MLFPFVNDAKCSLCSKQVNLKYIFLKLMKSFVKNQNLVSYFLKDLF